MLAPRALPVLVVVLVAASFAGSVGNGWVDLDDPHNFLDNHGYRGLGLPQLRWMFTTAHMAHYTPLTWLTLGLDYVVWGLEPAGYHLTSLLLHAAVALLVYRVAVRLLALAGRRDRREPAVLAGATLAALLFAIHPLRVESVAWVTERRDVVCGVFYVGAVLAYLRGVEVRGRGGPLVWVLAAGALLSKSMAVSLPVVLLVLDVYPLRRLGGGAGWTAARLRPVLVEKAPLFALSLAAAAGAILGQAAIGNLTPLARYSVLDRLVMSVYGLAFYPWKTLLPTGLSPLYERPAAVDLFAPRYVVAAVAVAGITVLAVVLRRRAPALLAAWAVYSITVLPVLAFFQNGPHLNADRYSYLTCVPWALLAGGAFAAAWRRLETRAWALVIPAWAMILALQTATAAQVVVWHDPVSMWERAAAVQPDGGMIQFSLGRALQERGDLPGAEAAYRRVVALESRSRYLAWNNLGVVVGERGRTTEALEAFLQAVRLEPRRAIACANARRAAAELGVSPPELATCGDAASR